MINKANATVTADSNTVTYNGLTQAVTTFTASGLQGSDTASMLTGVSVSGSGKNVGAYTITASGTDQNYDLNFVTGSLQINKASATVTANSNTVTYNGQTQTVSGFTASGLVGGETASVLTGVTASGSGVAVGTYATKAKGIDQNYDLAFIDGILQINQSVDAGAVVKDVIIKTDNKPVISELHMPTICEPNSGVYKNLVSLRYCQ